MNLDCHIEDEGAHPNARAPLSGVGQESFSESKQVDTLT